MLLAGIPDDILVVSVHSDADPVVAGRAPALPQHEDLQHVLFVLILLDELVSTLGVVTPLEPTLLAQISHLPLDARRRRRERILQTVLDEGFEFHGRFNLLRINDGQARNSASIRARSLSIPEQCLWTALISSSMKALLTYSLPSGPYLARVLVIVLVCDDLSHTYISYSITVPR
jgi:hypothetical protein